jgi:hypothetical protein
VALGLSRPTFRCGLTILERPREKLILRLKHPGQPGEKVSRVLQEADEREECLSAKSFTASGTPTRGEIHESDRSRHLRLG